MKIGVLGYRGRLGKVLVNKYQCLPIDVDVSKDQDVLKYFEDNDYDAVVNCAAYTDVDGAENDLLRAYAVNAYGPQNVARAYSGYLIHLSSDYIFDGFMGPYRESDFASPLSSYGFSKHLGEVGLQPYVDRTLIVRTTVLYDAGPQNNFVLAVYNQLKEGKTVKAPKSLIGNPTYCEHLADGIQYCLEKRFTGILNIAGKTRLSRFDLAEKIAKFFGFDSKKILNSPAWGDAKRPERCGLILDRAKYLGVPLYSLWEGLDAFKRTLEEVKVADSQVSVDNPGS